MRDRSTDRVSRRETGPSSRLPPLRPQNIPLARKERPQREERDARMRVPPEREFELAGVYVISVAARILDMHPQTLRKYERLGLINPDRTGGMLRLYSREDIRKILLIRHLMDNLGLNLAGVEFALALVDNLLNVRKRLGEAAQSDTLKDVVDRELSQLFRNLNLPVEEYSQE